MKKGKEKRRKIALIKGKGLKNESFWAIISKKFRGVGEKNEKGEGIKDENYIKKGGKGPKNAPFWAIISKTIRGVREKK